MSARQGDVNRHRMLTKVRHDWIDGYLQSSLHNLARIELSLEEESDLVSRPWDLIVQQPDRAPRPLPPGQAMGATFDELGQALLILGAPGAGKTTLLLELARDLLDRAAQETNHPIPVVFHLASWAARRRPLTDWLVDELTERYYVPRKVAQAWIEAEQVLPLLDGLDEVAPEHRAACVKAINTFRHQHGQVGLAVCSRTVEYKKLHIQVEVSGSVAIQPLSREQVSAYLEQTGESLAGVRTVLQEDDTLWELLQTPLMLSIVALAYQGRSAAQVQAAGSLEERRRHLFENYTRRMFERRTKVTEYTPEQTLRWLAWLARSLIHSNLSVFYMERMQPYWLPSKVQRRIVDMIPKFGGPLAGLLTGLIMALSNELIVGLIVGLFQVQMLAASLYYSVVYRRDRGNPKKLMHWRDGRIVWVEVDQITPAEVLRWGLGGVSVYASVYVEDALFHVLFGLVSGLVIGLVYGGLLAGLIVGLSNGLLAGLLFGQLGRLFGGLLFGLTPGQIVTRTIPNEGIQRSLRDALISFLVGGLFGGLLYGLLTELLTGLSNGLFGGLLTGLTFGLLAGLTNGGSTYLKHYMLRFLLWCNDYAPWYYIRFLDYAAERVFLRKVGGGYIFTHRLLMEYFATLQPSDQAGQTKIE